MYIYLIYIKYYDMHEEYTSVATVLVKTLK